MCRILSWSYRISYKASVAREWRSHIFQVLIVSGLSSSVLQAIRERAMDVTSSDTDIVSQVGWNRVLFTDSLSCFTQDARLGLIYGCIPLEERIRNDGSTNYS